MAQLPLFVCATIMVCFIARNVTANACVKATCDEPQSEHMLLARATVVTRAQSGDSGSRAASLDVVTQNKEADATPSFANRIANTSIVINASVSAVWEATVSNMATWKTWNDVFDARIDVPASVGAEFKIESKMEGAPFETTVTPMILSKVSKEKGTVCWKMNQAGIPASMLWAEHCFVLSNIGANKTHVHNYEDQGGHMAKFVERLMGSYVEAGFERFNMALRAKCESADVADDDQAVFYPNAQMETLQSRAVSGSTHSKEATLDASTQGKSSELPGPINRVANTSIVVQAPVASVWKIAVTDMADWKNWNEVFDANMKSPPAVGARFKIKSYMEGAAFPKTTTPMVMTEFDKNAGTVCWRMNMPGVLPAMLWAQHCLIFSASGSGSTFVHNYENQGGSLAGFVGRIMGKAVSKSFDDFNVDLKAECEKTVTESL